MRRARLFFHLDCLVGALGLVLVGVSLVGVSGASAETTVGDGSDWGPQGLLASSTAVTSTWTNSGNVSSSQVPRDATQVVAHANGRTYADIAQADKNAYASYFGASNGLGGLQVTVSQTQDLVNQAVTVDISGAKANIPAGEQTSTSYFQIFQCWGAMGSDGHPDASASAPDPATCQVGARGADSAGASFNREYRFVAGDPMVTGGDWAQYDKTTPFRPDVPFLAIDGTPSDSTQTGKNVYFNHTTTNELSDVTVPASGTTSRQFELQTGSESQGLGCGLRADQTSTATCWLVVVPRIAGVDENLGPISPTVWAQRMQFKLGFQDVPSGCATGQSRSLLSGSEMLADAAASWIPQVCTSRGVDLGYTRLGDETARAAFASGDSPGILTSDPVPASTPSVAVPLALTAPVIAFNIDYRPTCTDPNTDIHTVSTDPGAVACGYSDLAALKADLAKEGQPIRDLRLNADLVAKLLTMSYQSSMVGCLYSTCGYYVFKKWLPAWTTARPASLTADPEFRALNPQLHLQPDSQLGSMVLEAGRSDAASQIWAWLLADPSAASFLSGCPDAHGVTVNPFFSSRTYTGCSSQAPTLDAQATSDRRAMTQLTGSPVDQPTGFVDQAQTYPPDGTPYPLPSWEEVSATGTQAAQTLVDTQPPVANMATGARDAFIGYRPANSQFCASNSGDLTCTPAPGKWKDPKTPQAVGSRQILTITDTPSAARYQLPTARLCDDAGTDCIGANTASLQAAAARFRPSAVSGYVGPGDADYAAGAYPLTLPVYAAVSPSLSDSARASYADAFTYVTGAGQTPGYSSGDLPPGYAPLTSDLAAAAATGITALRQAHPTSGGSGGAGSTPTATATHQPTHHASHSPSATPTSSATAGPSTGASPTGITSTSGGGNGGNNGGLQGAPSGGVPSSGSSGAVPASATVTTEAATQTMSASTETWPGWVLPLGLGMALMAGLAGPFLRRRSTVRLR